MGLRERFSIRSMQGILDQLAVFGLPLAGEGKDPG
jgi:hypothetical protein